LPRRLKPLLMFIGFVGATGSRALSKQNRTPQTESRVPAESHVDLFSDAVLTGVAVAGGKLTG
jgi:hypothetical protein